MSSLRVLLVGPSQPEMGGLPRYVKTLRTYLDTQPGLDLHDLDETAVKGYASIVSRPSPTTMARGSARMLTELGRSIRRLRPGVVHIHTASGRSFAEKAAMAALSRRLGAPSLVHVHGSALDVELPAMSSRKRRVFSAAFALPNRLVVLSPRMQRILAEVLPGVETIVIGNSVQPPVALEPRRDGPVRVGFLGMFEGRKGERDLVDAVARCNNTSFQLLMAGDGNQRKELEAKIAEHGLSDRVQLLGAVFDDAKHRFLSDIDVLSLPSHAENLPISLLEAMSYGKAVISTTVGGITDLVHPGTDGWLHSAGDVAALAAVLDTATADLAELERLGANGRTLVENEYVWPVNGARVVATYHAMAKR